MNKNDIKKIIVDLHSETASLSDPKTKDTFNTLLNVIEKLYSENESLKEQNQQLKDEVNCLKGEQGKPRIKANSQPSDHSSEKERKENDDPSDEEKNKKKKKNKRQRKSKLTNG